jgi:hypothetical protein
MALDNSSDISAALSQRFAPAIARQYNRVTVLAGEIESEPASAARNAKNVAWDVLLGDLFNGFGQVASAYNEGTDVSAAEKTADSIVPATIAWALYRDAISVTDLEFDEAYQDGGGSATATSVRLLEERILSATSTLASLGNVDLWNGTGTATSGAYVGAPNVIGFNGGALSSSGTYAGISTANYPSWSGNTLGNGGVPRPLTVDLMSSMESLIFNACSEKPDLIVCSTHVWQKYNSIFEPLRRENDDKSVYSTSVNRLMWRGIPVIRDKDALEANGAGVMLFLNRKHCKKVFLEPSKPSHSDVWKAPQSDLEGFNGDQMRTPMSLPVIVIPLARTGDYSNYMVKVTWQLKVTRRNSCGIIADISIV